MGRARAARGPGDGGPRSARRGRASRHRAGAGDRRADRLRARALRRVRAACGERARARLRRRGRDPGVGIRAADPLRARDARAAGGLPPLPRGRVRRGPRRDPGLELDHRRARGGLHPRGRLPARVADAGRGLHGRRGGQRLPPVLALLPRLGDGRGLGVPGRRPRGLERGGHARATTPTTGSPSSSGSLRTGPPTSAPAPITATGRGGNRPTAPPTRSRAAATRGR